MNRTWQELKPELVTALRSAFNEEEFKVLLEFDCKMLLHDLVARDVPFPRKVREVVDDAERKGWLKCLVEAVRDKRLAHADLQARVADVLAGIDAHGKAFYEESAIAEEAGISEDAVLKRKLYRTWKQCSGAPTPCR